MCVFHSNKGLDLAMDGIVLPTDHSGRSTGEAYIQFASRDYADKAMSKHKDKIGHRWAFSLHGMAKGSLSTEGTPEAFYRSLLLFLFILILIK